MSSIPTWIWFAAIPSIIAIAIIDYFCFRDWFKCENCHYSRVKWYNWLLPTTLEILLFLSGIAIGYIVRG